MLEENATRNGFIRTCYEYRRKRKTKNKGEEKKRNTYTHKKSERYTLEKKGIRIGLSNGIRMSYCNDVVDVDNTATTTDARYTFYAVVAKLP